MELCPELRAEPFCVLQLKLRLESGLDEVGTDVCAGLDSGIEQIRRVHAAGKPERGFRMLCKKFL